MSPNGAQAVNGKLYLLKLQIRSALTLSNLVFAVGAAGSGASTGSFGGLYNSSGTLLTSSADIGAQLASAGWTTATLTTPQALTAGTFVWAAFLCNLAVSAPFLPVAWGANTNLQNLNLTAATAQFASGATGQTSLPASITPSGLTIPAFAWWVGGS
jgi:hypothetical protein